MQQWLTEHAAECELVLLPGYAPELNPDGTGLGKGAAFGLERGSGREGPTFLVLLPGGAQPGRFLPPSYFLPPFSCSVVLSPSYFLRGAQPPLSSSSGGTSVCPTSASMPIGVSP
ncbi:MAG: hypothetical protein ACE5HE_08560 [Phycisphaerae bacterium]